MNNIAKQFWAPQAWLNHQGGHAWHDAVLFRSGDDGRWAEIQTGVPAPAGAEVLAGPALPGMVNAHSHAFQRAFAGLAEHRHADRDDFWTWRDRMYSVALRITPRQQRAIAEWLFIEFLHGGYTQVCEFHYLHTRPDGTAYPDPLAMTWPLVDAATTVGIGMTMIPVVYERAGFDSLALRDDQRRFKQRSRTVWEQFTELSGYSSTISSAIGVHSLRAASPESLRELLKLAENDDGPFHLHIAEQTGEVDACLKATGRRPIEWLASEGLLDERFQLVHATHTTPSELDAIADAGAGIILCPTTEGNLGDGFCDFPGMLACDIPVALGSDSQVGRSWTDELRLVESVQRLRSRQRCLSPNPERGEPSTGQRLTSLALQGGANAAGFKTWGLTVGARADILVADTVALTSVPKDHWLDMLIFAAPPQPWRDVCVAGRWVIRNHVHHHEVVARSEFEDVMKVLWLKS